MWITDNHRSYIFFAPRTCTEISTSYCSYQRLFNKERSLSRVLHCDKTRQAFENTKEM